MRRVRLFPHREKISQTRERIGAGEILRAEFGGSQREAFEDCYSDRNLEGDKTLPVGAVLFVFRQHYPSKGRTGIKMQS